MKVCVVGLGYIGLPTACILALNGHNVVGIDINESVVDMINKGLVPINENKLDSTLKNLVSQKKIVAKTTAESADAYIICVPTPLNNNFSSNIQHVSNALESILPCVCPGNMIIIESTVPPGTIKNIIKPAIENRGFNIGEDIYLAYCPERVLPGNILKEIVYNDRIIGGVTDKCEKVVSTFYKTFVKGNIFITDSKTAEMTKIAENIYRDVNIALANQLSILCNELEINSLKVFNLANKHPRVNFLSPGPGVGGHCLPVDPYFVLKDKNDSSSIIVLSRKINENMPNYIASLAKKIINYIPSPKVTLWGVAYKGNIDDTRNSPSIQIINKLKELNCDLQIYDPIVKNCCIETKEESLKDSNLLIILTDHDEFKNLDPKLVLRTMRNPIILDSKNILDSISFMLNGIIVYNFGNFHLLN